jgi:hypothetical protein
MDLDSQGLQPGHLAGRQGADGGVLVQSRMCYQVAGDGSVKLSHEALLTLAKVQGGKARRCAICGGYGDWRGIVEHHIQPKGMGGSKARDVPENKIWLCGKCHSEQHGIREVDY